MSKKDIAVSTAYTNLYILGRKNKTIYLRNFDIMNLSHRALYSIAEMVASTQNFKVIMECSLIKYWKYKKVYKNGLLARRGRRWSRKDKLAAQNWPTCDEFIFHIEDAQHEFGIFTELYTAYYSKEN